LPSGSLYLRSSSPNWRTTSPRFGAGPSRQILNAACAFSTTASYSSLPVLLTLPMKAPSTGECDCRYLPEFDDCCPVLVPGLCFLSPSFFKKSVFILLILLV